MVLPKLKTGKRPSAAAVDSTPPLTQVEPKPKSGSGRKRVIAVGEPRPKKAAVVEKVAKLDKSGNPIKPKKKPHVYDLKSAIRAVIAHHITTEDGRKRVFEVSSDAVRQLNVIAMYFGEALATKAVGFTKAKPAQTTNEKDVIAAVTLVLPKEMSKRVCAYIHRALRLAAAVA